MAMCRTRVGRGTPVFSGASTYLSFNIVYIQGKRSCIISNWNVSKDAANKANRNKHSSFGQVWHGKNKATVQEKVEKMTSHGPVEKEEATQKKEARIAQAEAEKQAVREHNAAASHGGAAGTTGHGTGAHLTSAMPGHGHVTEGAVGSHPVGTNTGMGRTTAHNSRVGGGTGYTGL